MRYELLDYLVCPVCKGDFSLGNNKKGDGGEILQGLLVCKNCGKGYRIEDGVPRLVIDFREDATARRFSYEWKRFPKLSNIYEKQFLDWISPIDKGFFKGKVVLDAGCGKGRHLYLSSIFGAKTVIGMDVSDAVEVAYQNTKNLSNVHVVQANIYHPPLREGMFDYVYSIGVLHHLPDPGIGFRTIAGLLKPGGTISIWVYGREGNGWIIYFVNPLRKILTSKMPLSMLRIVSFPIALLLYGLCMFIYKPVNLYIKPLREFLFYMSICFISQALILKSFTV